MPDRPCSHFIAECLLTSERMNVQNNFFHDVICAFPSLMPPRCISLQLTWSQNNMLASIIIHYACREGGCIVTSEDFTRSKLSGPHSVKLQAWVKYWSGIGCTLRWLLVGSRWEWCIHLSFFDLSVVFSTINHSIFLDWLWRLAVNSLDSCLFSFFLWDCFQSELIDRKGSSWHLLRTQYSFFSYLTSTWNCWVRSSTGWGQLTV